jgi:hypothetical protein
MTIDQILVLIAFLVALAFFAYYLYRQLFWRTRKFELNCPLDGVEAFELMIHHDDIKRFRIYFTDDNGEIKIGELTTEEEQSSFKES